MTTVHISLGRDDGTDKTAAKGVVEWEPTTRREDGTMVILERGFVAPLVDGEVTVVVDPSGLTWCWRVTERTDSGGTVRYVSVPNSASTVEYVDLPDVDPTTLVAWSPADPEAAYLASLGTAVDDYLTANPVSAPVDSVNGQTGAVALGAADVGADPAGTAAGLVGALVIPDSPDDIGAASAAHTHAPEDVTGTAVITTDARLSDARTPLAHSHTLADVTDAGDAAGLDVGTTAGTVMAGDDSRVTSLSSTYVAKAGAAGIITRDGSGNITARQVSVTTPLSISNPGGVAGNITIVDDYRIVGTGSPYASVTPPRVGVEYIDTAQTNGARKWISTGTTNTSWVVTDGDTGWRIVSGGLLNGWEDRSAGNFQIRICRRNNTVILVSRTLGLSAANATANTFLPLFSGFKPSPAGGTYGSLGLAGVGLTLSSEMDEIKYSGSGYMMIGFSTNRSYEFEIHHETDEPWPTTLPGTPA